MKKTPGRTSDLSPSPTPPEVLDAFLSFFAAVVAFNPGVPERRAAPAPQADRQQRPRTDRRAASADDAGVPEERRDLRPARSRFQRRHHDRVAEVSAFFRYASVKIGRAHV